MVHPIDEGMSFNAWLSLFVDKNPLITPAMEEELSEAASAVCRREGKHIAQLQEIIDKNDICHNLHGKVDAEAFADGCATEQRKLYGYAPDADELKKLKSCPQVQPVAKIWTDGKFWYRAPVKHETVRQHFVPTRFYAIIKGGGVYSYWDLISGKWVGTLTVDCLTQNKQYADVISDIRSGTVLTFDFIKMPEDQDG